MTPRPRPFVPKLNEAEEGTLKGQLFKLGLYTMAASFEAEADRAAKDETPYAAYLARLIELELADKADRSVNARIARARFPVLRTLEEFDFAFQPGLPAARVRELVNLAFLDQATNVLFIGGPGVGKTHLAIGLALKACAARRSVLFSSAADLLDELVAADVSHSLGSSWRICVGWTCWWWTNSGTCPWTAAVPTYSSSLSPPATLAARSSSPATCRLTAGASCSARTCWPPPFSTASCIRARSSPSTARATA